MGWLLRGGRGRPEEERGATSPSGAEPGGLWDGAPLWSLFLPVEETL